MLLSTITYFSRSLAFLYSFTSYTIADESGYRLYNVNCFISSYYRVTLTSYSSGLLAGAGCNEIRSNENIGKRNKMNDKQLLLCTLGIQQSIRIFCMLYYVCLTISRSHLMVVCASM